MAVTPSDQVAADRADGARQGDVRHRTAAADAGGLVERGAGVQRAAAVARDQIDRGLRADGLGDAGDVAAVARRGARAAERQDRVREVRVFGSSPGMAMSCGSAETASPPAPPTMSTLPICCAAELICELVTEPPWPPTVSPSPPAPAATTMRRGGGLRRDVRDRAADAALRRRSSRRRRRR